MSQCEEFNRLDDTRRALENAILYSAARAARGEAGLDLDRETELEMALNDATAALNAHVVACQRCKAA